MSPTLYAVWITFATTCPKAHAKLENLKIFFANGIKNLKNAGLPRMTKATFVVNLIQEIQLVMTSWSTENAPKDTRSKLHAVKIPSGGVWRLEMGTFAAMLLAKMQMPMIDNVHHLQDVGKGHLDNVGLGLLENVGLGCLPKSMVYQAPLLKSTR